MRAAGKRGSGKSKYVHWMLSQMLSQRAGLWLWIGVEERNAWKRRAEVLPKTAATLAYVECDGAHPALVVDATMDAAVQRYGQPVSGIVLDPASSIVDNDNDNAQVRAALQRFSKLDATIIAIKHTRKDHAGSAGRCR